MKKILLVLLMFGCAEMEGVDDYSLFEDGARWSNSIDLVQEGFYGSDAVESVTRPCFNVKLKDEFRADSNTDWTVYLGNEYSRVGGSGDEYEHRIDDVTLELEYGSGSFSRKVYRKMSFAGDVMHVTGNLIRGNLLIRNPINYDAPPQKHRVFCEVSRGTPASFQWGEDFTSTEDEDDAFYTSEGVRFDIPDFARSVSLTLATRTINGGILSPSDFSVAFYKFRRLGVLGGAENLRTQVVRLPEVSAGSEAWENRYIHGVVIPPDAEFVRLEGPDLINELQEYLATVVWKGVLWWMFFQ